ncbi:D-inositol-3-phosphate glycosyltransferase [Dyadobacter sp. CECT 9275]|uniref:D-inositol-3-phosphate glycosyltransferase n=1 Tax=Dyadobacter helix TaxID=2822344 RepID=A0A916JES3_9BACT|nr:glycosyltransferase [Dyadobacter sp. CECT 9275]CAG5008006.1 D-inositol-3-phosphate glycosyltransferase [Dyadobacter sp. CECT 9275]
MVQIKIKMVACLPVAGNDNPYQALMIEGLNQSGRLHAFNGVHDKFGGIIRTAWKYRPDYIHFDWITSYYQRRYAWASYLSMAVFFIQLVLVRNIWGTKFVWTLHNILPHNAEHIAMHRFCQRFFARRCEWIRIFSSHTLDRAASELNIPTHKFRVIPEGPYTTVYPNTITRNEARAYFGLPQDKMVFLYLGLIKPYKGISELLQAFHSIERQDKILIIAGRCMDPRYGREIKNEITPDVIFKDEFIPDHQLQYYFNAADMVVLPFLKIENSGSVILAMGFGKPVIAPMFGAVQERLCQQIDLLFTNHHQLHQKLLLSLDLSESILRNIGISNANQLKQFQWSDFAKAF